jgi:type VI secretion system secreted protein Hcp
MKKSLVACVLAAALVSSSTADAALSAYLKLKGQKSGEIKGGVIQKGREGLIEVIAAEHTVRADTGGRRTHGVYTITKMIDKSTPLLYRALASNESCDVEFQYYVPNRFGAAGGQGVETLAYTVKLTNARITQINNKMLNNKNPELTRYETFEEVSFTYDTITWTWTDGNVTATDSGFAKQ